MQNKIYRSIDLLREFGYRLPEPYSKTLKDSSGLKELRVKLATDICRLFYFHYKEKVYVVASGYVKKKDKTDKGLLRNNLFKLSRSIFSRSPRRDRRGIAKAYVARIATKESGKKTSENVQVVLQQALRMKYTGHCV